jgi:hypothetical protein
MNRREWYERVNAAWPAQVPALTGAEAVKAARRLFRWAGVAMPVVKETSGNRHNWGRLGGSFHVNPGKGWRELVHGVAHWAHYLLTRRQHVAPHDKAHARLELSMVRQVLKRGWLDGRLKPQERPERAPAKTSTDAKLEHARAMLRRADTRLKRADTIRRKWARRVKRLEKLAQPAAV